MKKSLKQIVIAVLVTVIGFALFSCDEQGLSDSVPGVPQNFTAVPGDGEVTLSWTEPEEDGGEPITGYQVSSNNGTTWVTAESNNNHTFTGLINGTVYTFKVRAVNANGYGAEAVTTAIPVGSSVSNDVTFISVTANGNAVQTTTLLTLVFSAAISGFNADDITLSGVANVNKGVLSVSGSTYTLPISGFTSGGTLTVAAAKTGFNISNPSRTVTIFYYTQDPPVNVPATGITLNRYTLSLNVGGMSQLTETVIPWNATNKVVTWQSSNTAVANVVNGLVIAIAEGTATITVTTVDGGHSTECEVTVSEFPPGGGNVIFTIRTDGEFEGLPELIELVRGEAGVTISLSSISPYSTAQWYMNGESKSSGGSFVLNANDFERDGTHFLGIFVVINGHLYSHTVQILVQD